MSLGRDDTLPGSVTVSENNLLRQTDYRAHVSLVLAVSQLGASFSAPFAYDRNRLIPLEHDHFTTDDPILQIWPIG